MGQIVVEDYHDTIITLDLPEYLSPLYNERFCELFPRYVVWCGYVICDIVNEHFGGEGWRHWEISDLEHQKFSTWNGYFCEHPEDNDGVERF